MNIDPSFKQALALAIVQRRRRDTELSRLQEECQSLKSQLNAATTDPLHHLATLSLDDHHDNNQPPTTTTNTTEQWSNTLSTWQCTLLTLPTNHFNILLKILHIHHHSTTQPPTQAMMHITPVTMACQFLTQLLCQSHYNNNNKEEEEEEVEGEKKQQQKEQQQKGNYTATATMDSSLIEGVAGCVISLLQVPSALNIHVDMESFHQLVDQLLMETCSDTNGDDGAVGIHNDGTTTTRGNSGGDMKIPPPPPSPPPPHSPPSPLYHHHHYHHHQQLAHHLLLTFLKAPLACMSVVKQSADAFSLTIQELLSVTITENTDKTLHGGRKFTSTTNTTGVGGKDSVNDGLTAPSSAVHEASPNNRYHHHHQTPTMPLFSPHDTNNVDTLEVIIYRLQEIVGSGLSALPGWIIEQQQEQQDNNNNGDEEGGKEYASEDVWHHNHNDDSMVDIDSYLSELSNTVQEAVNSAKLLAYTHPAVSNGASRVATQLMHALQIISTQGI